MTKPKLLTFAILLIFNYLRASTTCYMHVEDPSVFEAEIAFRNVENEAISYKILLDKTSGDARFAMDLPQATFVILQYKTQSVGLFMETDDDVQIFFTADSLRKTIRFEGKGADNNTCFVGFQNQFRNAEMTALPTIYLAPQLDAAKSDCCFEY